MIPFATICDVLLAKLLSGEIRINDVENFSEVFPDDFNQ